MANPLKILIIEDEEKIRNLLRLYLVKEGFAVEEAGNGREGLGMLEEKEYDLLLLDLMLPEVDGWTICRQVRQSRDLPIIMVTARGEEGERILGLELGADDYVVKPFSPREVTARVKALLRRSRKQEEGENSLLSFPQLKIDVEGRRVSWREKEIGLTPKEFDLLYFLASRSGRVFTREMILEQVWGYDFFGSVRTVDTHIKTLREKIPWSEETERIVTVWGVGYKFEVAG